MAKVRERLTMIFDYHIPNGIPIIESDRALIHALCRIYENGELDTLTKEPIQKPEPKQQGLFKSESTQDLFTKADNPSDAS